MIKLQNNFTTPEQSKRLLELGLPADSADMYYKHIMLTPYIFNNDVLFSVYSKVEDIIPCWSVGRLIEIQEKCTGARFFRTLHPDLLGDIMGQIEYTIGTVGIDFSKLEE